jgi:hypothetical protein
MDKGVTRSSPLEIISFSCWFVISAFYIPVAVLTPDHYCNALDMPFFYCAIWLAKIQVVNFVMKPPLISELCCILIPQTHIM